MNELMLKTKENVEIFMFLPPSPCRADCPIYIDCGDKNKGSCAVEGQYLQAVANSFSQDIAGFITQSVANKISLHIIPLYQMLFRFKLAATTVIFPFIENEKTGEMKTHPVFGEIRRTILTIESTLRNTGLDKEYIRAVEMVSIANGSWTPTQGNADYYEGLFGALKDKAAKNRRVLLGREE